MVLIELEGESHWPKNEPKAKENSRLRAGDLRRTFFRGYWAFILIFILTFNYAKWILLENR